jgi:hypothetical protein
VGSIDNTVVKKLLQLTFKWAALWLLIGAFVTFVLLPNGYNFSQFTPIIFSAFTIYSVILIWHYRVNSLLPHHLPFKRQAIEICLGVFMILLISRLFFHYAPVTEKTLARLIETDAGFPFFYWNTWLAKIGDVLFQQVFIFIFLRQLTQQQLATGFILKWFTVSFSIIHLPLLATLGSRGLYFIAPSVAGGFLFSWLILKRRRGLVYSFVAHMLFYFFLGLYFRYWAYN